MRSWSWLGTDVLAGTWLLLCGITGSDCWCMELQGPVHVVGSRPDRKLQSYIVGAETLAMYGAQNCCNFASHKQGGCASKLSA